MIMSERGWKGQGVVEVCVVAQQSNSNKEGRLAGRTGQTDRQEAQHKTKLKDESKTKSVRSRAWQWAGKSEGRFELFLPVR